MTEQCNLFESTDFSWDTDINRIHGQLVGIAERWGMKWDSKWEIWSHVPKYGYRMTFNFHFNRFNHIDDAGKENRFVEEIQTVCKEAKARQIDLTPYWDCNHYIYENAIKNGWFDELERWERDGITVYSTFEDKARRKRKMW